MAGESSPAAADELKILLFGGTLQGRRHRRLRRGKDQDPLTIDELVTVLKFHGPVADGPLDRFEHFTFRISRTARSRKAIVADESAERSAPILVTMGRPVTLLLAFALQTDADPLPAGAIRRLGTARLRQEYIADVAFSPDGRRLVSAGMEPDAIVWVVDDGRALLRLKGHTENVAAVAWSPAGDRIATGGKDNAVRLWDASSGRLLFTLAGHTAEVHAVAFSPDGLRLASGSDGGGVCLWTVADGTQGAEVRAFRGDIESLQFLPDGTLLVASAGGEFVVVDVGGGGDVRAILTGSAELRRAAISHDAARTAALMTDGKLLLGSGEGEPVEVAGPSGPECLTFSPDGTRLATGGQDRVLSIRDADTGTVLHELKGHAGTVAAVAFSPDGSTIATGGADNAVRLWDASTGRELLVSSGHQSDVMSVATAGGVIVSGSRDGTARVWSAEGVERGVRGPFAGDVHAAAVTEDGTLAAVGTEYGTVEVWETATGTTLWRNDQLEGSVRGVSFSPDGSILAAGAGSSVRLFDARSGRSTEVFQEHESTVRTVSFSPDGARLIVGDEQGTIILRALDKPRVLAQYNAGHGLVDRIRFLPDGQTLAVMTDDNQLTLMAALTGQTLAGLGQPDTNDANTLALSRDGRLIAVGGDDKVIVVLETASGRELHRFAEHGVTVWDLAFTPDGRGLVAACGDNSIMIYSLAPPAPLKELSPAELWETLAGDDVPRAYAAVWALAADADAEAFLRERTARPSEDVLRRLIRSLDSDDVAERDEATAELIRLDAREVLLELELGDKGSPELKSRVRLILDELGGPVKRHPSGLQRARAFHALELRASGR